MTEDHIVMAPVIHVGGTVYHPGDKFEEASHLKAGDLNDRNVHLLKRHMQVVPLTRDSFATATAKRLVGSPPLRGFTDAYLIEKGIIDEPLKREEPATPQAAAAPQPILKVEHTAETVQVGEFFRTPRKAGPNVVWDVTNAAGELLRTRGFMKVDKADEFIATLKPPASTDPESSGNGEEPEEKDHDRDVRSGPDDEHQQGEDASGRHEHEQS